MGPPGGWGKSWEQGGVSPGSWLSFPCWQRSWHRGSGWECLFTADGCRGGSHGEIAGEVKGRMAGGRIAVDGHGIRDVFRGVPLCALKGAAVTALRYRAGQRTDVAARRKPAVNRQHIVHRI